MMSCCATRQRLAQCLVPLPQSQKVLVLKLGFLFGNAGLLPGWWVTPCIKRLSVRKSICLSLRITWFQIPVLCSPSQVSLEGKYVTGVNGWSFPKNVSLPTIKCILKCKWPWCRIRMAIFIRFYNFAKCWREWLTIDIYLFSLLQKFEILLWCKAFASTDRVQAVILSKVRQLWSISLRKGGFIHACVSCSAVELQFIVWELIYRHLQVQKLSLSSVPLCKWLIFGNLGGTSKPKCCLLAYLV